MKLSNITALLFIFLSLFPDLSRAEFNHVSIKYYGGAWDKGLNFLGDSEAAPPGNGFIIKVGDAIPRERGSPFLVRPVYFLTNAHVWDSRELYDLSKKMSEMSNGVGDFFLYAKVEIVDPRNGQCHFRNSTHRYWSYADTKRKYREADRGFKVISLCHQHDGYKTTSGSNVWVASGAACDFALVRMLVPERYTDFNRGQSFPFEISAYRPRLDVDPRSSESLYVQNGALGLSSTRQPHPIEPISPFRVFEIQHKGTTYSLVPGWSGSPVVATSGGTDAIGILFTAPYYQAAPGVAFHMNFVFQRLDVENKIADDLKDLSESPPGDPTSVGAWFGLGKERAIGYCGN
jgi:hypothetical protein